VTADANRQRLRPGPVARCAALLMAVGLVVATAGTRLNVAAAACLLVALFLHPAGFSVLRRPMLWGLLTLLVLPPLVFTTPREVPLPAGLAVASAGLRLAWAMLVRTVVVAVAAAGFAATVSARELTGLFEAVGLRGLGFSLGVAVHTLPLATRTWTTSARALRLRGGFRRRWAGDLMRLAMTVIGNALRHADEVVEAAQARGFSPDRARREAVPGWPADLGWIAAWMAMTALVLLAA
jgi:energy-coupling factor transporter transmembrane protein EcfT